MNVNYVNIYLEIYTEIKLSFVCNSVQNTSLKGPYRSIQEYGLNAGFLNTLVQKFIQKPIQDLYLEGSHRFRQKYGHSRLFVKSYSEIRTETNLSSV